MAQVKKAARQKAFRFQISPQDASLSESHIEKLLKSATAEAAAEAQRDGYQLAAKSALEGGFGGIGEIVALLVLAAKSATGAKIIAAGGTVAAELGKGFMAGAGAAGGKLFFDKYLKPRLVKLNLLPSKFRSTVAESSPPAPKKKPSGRKRG
jgi:hypothetical protein